MEMHNPDRSSSGYRRPTELSRTPTKETDELKETKSSPTPKNNRKLSFHLMCIRHSCSPPRSKAALKVYTQRHGQRHTRTDASLHWAVVACFVAFAHGLFSPSVLFIPSREREREKEKKIKNSSSLFLC